jgi:hypothetical protein
MCVRGGYDGGTVVELLRKHGAKPPDGWPGSRPEAGPGTVSLYRNLPAHILRRNHHPTVFPHFLRHSSFCLPTSKYEEYGNASSGYTSELLLLLHAACCKLSTCMCQDQSRTYSTVKRVKSSYVHRDKWNPVGLTLFLFPCEWFP